MLVVRFIEGPGHQSVGGVVSDRRIITSRASAATLAPPSPPGAPFSPKTHIQLQNQSHSNGLFLYSVLYLNYLHLTT